MPINYLFIKVEVTGIWQCRRKKLQVHSSFAEKQPHHLCEQVDVSLEPKNKNINYLVFCLINKWLTLTDTYVFRLINASMKLSTSKNIDLSNLSKCHTYSIHICIKLYVFLFPKIVWLHWSIYVTLINGDMKFMLICRNFPAESTRNQTVYISS